MREFFRGWRRKAGCVALVMACALMAMWMRSRVYGDWIRVGPNSARTCFLASFQGSVKWIVSINSSVIPGSPQYRFSMTERYLDDETLMPIHGGEGYIHNWVWQWGCFGCRTGAGTVHKGPYQFEVVVIPYWWVTLPLSLLSAYLLLWKPRLAKDIRDA